MSDKKSLPFPYVFAAGAIGGVTELLCMFPTDTVKTRMQLAVGPSKPGMMSIAREILAQEGVRRFYRGIVPPLFMEAPKRAVKFASNDFWSKTYLGWFGAPVMTQSLAVLTGCSAGATEAWVVVPFELVKIRLQDKSSKYTGAAHVVRSIVREDGILGMYKGLESTMLRHITWNAGYFGSIFGIRKALPVPKTEKEKLLNNFLAGGIGGTIGTVLNTPFDVVKSRIQNQKSAIGIVPKYNWTFPAVATVMKEEGPRALWAGFTPKVLRLGPGGGVLLIVVEYTMGIFRTMLGPPY